MRKVAKFEKVSFDQFYSDCKEFLSGLTEKEIRDKYDSIILPRRATIASAGYDFFTYSEFTLKPHETIKIPTGIRCKIDEDYVLLIAPRSGLGFKYRLQLDNTIGVIDSDYYSANNQGHIFIKITNDSNFDKTLMVKENEAFAQGIFVQYGITCDDKVETIRTGGLGSTSK